ncbi:MAG TPA: glycerate kinase [Thermoanaerobacterales bacterium]|nr:glycerate kinase [Thermoanaerobacterales bacterium]
MKIIVAPDSFKSSMSAISAANAIERGIKKAGDFYNTNYDVIKVPMADGGEGTVDAVINSIGGRKIYTEVLDPLGRKINSFFGILGKETAIIEMAASSGLHLLSDKEKNPMETTTYGTGQLIKRALDEGCKHIIIGLGGSATNDGGVGMAQALGIKFLDNEGREIGFGGQNLKHIKSIDISGLDKRIDDVKITVASDVKNPLCGPQGASAVYGPQKGATPEMIKILDDNLKHLTEIIKKDLKKDIRNIPGAGAAGGLGAALIAFLDANIRSGIEIIMELSNFEQQVENCDVVITGEGSTDYQTMFGKVPYGVGQVAKKYNKPLICISGSLKEGYESLYDEGVTALFSISPGPISLKDSIERGDELLERVSENVMRIFFLRGDV